jgi:lipopolysaccharide transport system ATP-binding protein
MGNTVIKVENLSKQYRLGLVGASTFKEDTARWWAKMRGKEDPFLALGSENDRTSISDSKFVWSLKDINFEIKQGEVLGIVGRNGAGKSTLLKILSKITSPTTGTIKAKGRIASLLEVGTGFHPELTGRENIFLNGAILGMRKHEIKSKLEEIISFAGVERYIDTPVKRYSSGMYVRLAFAVAAHLESEILIVDEVLAVGDAEFQQQCLGKMGEVSNNEGRTILFVSHNISAIRSLCTTGILLQNGLIKNHGEINNVLKTYTEAQNFGSLNATFKKGTLSFKDIELINVDLKDVYNVTKTIFEVTEILILNLTYLCTNKVPGTYAYFEILNKEGVRYIQTDSNDFTPNIFEDIKVGYNKYKIVIPKNILTCGEYKINLTLASPYMSNWTFDYPGEVVKFKIVDTVSDRGSKRSAITSQFLKWEEF